MGTSRRGNERCGDARKDGDHMTHDAELDLLGIGNAIVNVLAHCDDAFLEAEGLAKGSMNLIEVEESNGLYDRMGPGVEVSGGAAANSMAGAASLRQPRRVRRQDPRRPARSRVSPRHPRRRGPFRDADRARRPAHGAKPDPGDARRPPDHVNLPRRRGRARARGHRHRSRGPLRRHLPGGLPLGQAARQGRLPRGDGGRPGRRAPRVVDALGLVLRRAPSRGVPGARRRPG